MSSSIENTKRVVVARGDRFTGNLIPGSLQELHREVFVEAGAEVTGCVFGRSVTIEGPASIGKAVYGTKEVKFTAYGRVVCHSSVGAREGVFVAANDPDTPEEEQLDWVLVRGDVFSRTVTLNRVAVLGSVRGSEVRLTECLVLGGVHGSELVQMSGTTALTVSGRRVGLGAGCGLIHPHAVATDDLQLAAPVRYVAVDSPYALLDHDDIERKDGLISLRPGRRLTDLSKQEGRIDNLAKFLVSRTVGEDVRSNQRLSDYQFDSLPEEFHPLRDIDPDG